MKKRRKTKRAENRARGRAERKAKRQTFLIEKVGVLSSNFSIM